MDLQELITLFLADVCGGKSNTTEEAYRSKLRRLTAFFGCDFDPKQITRSDLDSFKHDLQNRKTHRRGGEEVKGGLSPFTIRTCLVTVRFLFSWASSKGYIPISPMEGVRIQDAPKPQPKAVSEDTVLKLLHAAATTGENWERARDVALIYLLRDTGGRVGGLVTCRLGDLDLRRGFVMVTEKGNIQRPLFLTHVTVEALKTWLDWRPFLDPPEDYIFVGISGEALSTQGIRRALQRIAKRAQITGERYNPHSFRHAFARDSLQNGAELSQVSAMLGHTTTSVTSAYYARWTNGELKKSHNQYSPVLSMPEITPEFEGVSL